MIKVNVEINSKSWHGKIKDPKKYFGKKLKYNNPKIITIIVAFSEQEINSIFVNEKDQSLDYILNEKKIIKVENK